jgi:hypothetical protein
MAYDDETTELVLTKTQFRLIQMALGPFAGTLAECLEDMALTDMERLAFELDSSETEELIEFMRQCSKDLEWS